MFHLRFNRAEMWKEASQQHKLLMCFPFTLPFPKVLGTFLVNGTWVLYFCGVFIFVLYSDLVLTSKLQFCDVHLFRYLKSREQFSVGFL